MSINRACRFKIDKNLVVFYVCRNTIFIEK